MDPVSAALRNPKIFWCFVQNSVERRSMPLLKFSNGVSASSLVEKLSALNEYFDSVQQRCSTHCGEQVGFAEGELPAELYLSGSDICESLSQLCPKISSGPFPLTIKLSKIGGSSLVVPLELLFTKIMKSRTFPKSCKTFCITPIPKRRCDQTEPSNCCPIAGLVLRWKYLSAVLLVVSGSSRKIVRYSILTNMRTGRKCLLSFQ